MPWAAVANIAGSVLGDAVSSGINYAANSALQRDAQRHQEKLMQNAKQWQVEDLRKAGLNPILATGLNTSAPGSPLSSYSGASNSALREAMASLRKKESQVADEQIATAQSAQKLNDAQAAKAKAEAERVKVDTQKAKAETQSAEIDADYREAEKWLNGVGKVAGAGAAIGGGAYALTKFAPALTSSRQISGFAETVKKNPIPARVVDAIRAGGPKAKAILKKAVRVGGGGLAVWLLTEAVRKGSQYSFERESKAALEDKRREKQGKGYKSTFNIDRHF